MGAKEVKGVYIPGSEFGGGVFFHVGENDELDRGEKMTAGGVYGDALKLDSEAVKAAMSALGVTSFQGIRFAPAAEYLRKLKIAEEAASNGEFRQMQAWLEEALKSGQEARIPCEKRVADIRRLGAVNGFPKLMDEARTEAAKGEFHSAEWALKLAKEAADISGGAFSDSEAAETMKEAGAKALPGFLRRMEEDSRRDDSVSLSSSASTARRAANAAGIPFDESNVDRLLLPALWTTAERRASDPKEGYSRRHTVTEYLSEAREVSARLEVQFDEQRAAGLMAKACWNDTEERLSDKNSYPDLNGFDESIAEALKWSKEARQTVDEAHVQEMKRTYYTRAIEGWLASIDQYVSQPDHASAVPERIRQVEAAADQIGYQLDREHLARAAKTAEAAMVTNHFKSAEEVFQGFVDGRLPGQTIADTFDIVELKLYDAKKAAEDGGVSFDQARADALRQKMYPLYLDAIFEEARKNALYIKEEARQSERSEREYADIEHHFQHARNIARRIKKTFDQRRAMAIVTLANSELAQRPLAAARREAQHGYYMVTSVFLGMAGVERTRAKQIQRSAHEKALQENFGIAELLASNPREDGSSRTDSIQFYLDEAREVSAELGIPFDEARAKRILETK